MQLHLNTFAATQRQEREDRSWQKQLPAEWRPLVVVPLDLRRYQDYEMAANRVVGYDADEKPCFTSHSFSLTEPRSDDGEEFYTVLAYGEELAAWRLRDDRWLVWREVHADEDCLSARSFYTLAQSMPR